MNNPGTVRRLELLQSVKRRLDIHPIEGDLCKRRVQSDAINEFRCYVFRSFKLADFIDR